MKQDIISQTVGNVLRSLWEDEYISWPNGTTPDAESYVAFSHVRVSSDDQTLSGGSEVQTGYFLLTVVSPATKFATYGEIEAEKIKDLFPYGNRISFFGGSLCVNKPSMLLSAYRDQADWRTPVKVSYEATGISATASPGLPEVSDLSDIISSDPDNALTIGGDGKLYATDDELSSTQW